MSESHGLAGDTPAPPGDSPGAQERQPSEEEVRAYLAQLRQAGVADIVAQAFSLLASGAEVKLGRRDARLLIDLAAAVADVGGPHVEERLRQQMQQALNQLRVGQVDAESQLAKLRAEGKLPPEEAGDLPEGAAAAGGGQPSQTERQQTGRQETPQASERPSSGGSRLWIPGR